MPAKKKNKPKAEEKTNVPAIVNSQLMTATIIEPKTAQRSPDIQRPAFLQAEGALEKEAPVGFTPLIAFGPDPDNWRPGAWIVARYIRTREAIGPNASRMYDLEIFDGKGFTPVSLWGSTILDNKMVLLNPAIGKWLFVQYCGLITTSRNQNPAKDFDVAIVSEKLLEKLVDSKHVSE